MFHVQLALYDIIQVRVSGVNQLDVQSAIDGDVLFQWINATNLNLGLWSLEY